MDPLLRKAFETNLQGYFDLSTDETDQYYDDAHVSNMYASFISGVLYQEKLQKWQPISTAPKDGTAVFVCVLGFKPTVARYLFNQWITTDEGDYADREEWLFNWGTNSYVPDVWLPIPALAEGK